MPLQSNKTKDNCVHIMNNVIKNLKPNTFNKLLEEVLESNIKNSKKEIEKYIRKRLNLVTSNPRHTKQYWLARGWSFDEAYIKAKENTRANNKSVYSRKFWLEKINPATNKPYTIVEADFERNSRRPIRKEYWIKKGYLESDSQDLAQQTKNNNNKKGASGSARSNVHKITSKRCVEYYTTRGYSKLEAKELVSKGQKYFSKKICIEKYGEIRGFSIWKDRQFRWQETLKSKSSEEIARINRLKLTKGITVSAAEKEILNEFKKLNLNLPAIHQFTLIDNNKKQYIYDIAVNKRIIEYHGDFWHCNPKKYSPDYVNPKSKIKAHDKWQMDFKKIQFAKDQGYEVLVVWESDFKSNKEKVIEQCIQFLLQ